jgi:hypothetical protein
VTVSNNIFRLTLREMRLFILIGLSPGGITSDPLLGLVAPPMDDGSGRNECTDDVPLVCFNSLSLDADRLSVAGITANIIPSP